MVLKNEQMASLEIGHDSEDLVDQLRELVEGIATMARSSGIKLVAHRPESWTYYRSLPVLRKREILESCSTFHKICANTVREGRPLTDTRALLWSSLKYFNLAPCSDLMDYTHDHLVVELYDSDGRQIFRNFKFMELCSYTLADVLLYPWWELFSRNDEAIGELIKEINIALSGELSRTLISTIREHHTAEVFSERRHVFKMQFKSISPVFDRVTKKSIGFVCVSEADVIATREVKPVPNQAESIALPIDSISS